MYEPVKKYRKKPIVVEAMQISKNTLCSLFTFIGESKNYPACKVGGMDPNDGKFKLITLEGVLTVEPGDWIIKGINGEFYPCKPDIFKKTYEAIEEDSEPKRRMFDDDDLNKLYNMKIHEMMELPTNFHIMVYRVPGGWLYVFFGSDGKFTTTFVPFCQYEVSEMHKYYEKQLANISNELRELQK